MNRYFISAFDLNFVNFTLICVQCMVIFLFEVKTISNMKTRELHNLPRVIQPFAGKPVGLFPVLQRASQKVALRTSNEESKQGVESQVKGKRLIFRLFEPSKIKIVDIRCS